MARSIIILAAALAASACSQGTAPLETVPMSASATPPPSTRTPEQLRQSMDSGVFEPYTKADYPKLYAKLGKPDPTMRIQALREAAAFKALESGRCDRVEISDVSNQRTTREEITVFVDCTNRERFYISERDISTNSAAVANSQMTITRGQALERCVQAARSVATFPSLLDPHIWTGSSYQTYPTMGTALVRLDFDATNALGVQLPYTAECFFRAGKTAPEIIVSPR